MFWDRVFYLGVLIVMSIATAHANVVINGTRVIYDGSQREVTVHMTNEGDTPSLVQSWIDAGNPDALPEAADVPFMLVPPVARVNPRSAQALRIAFQGDPLPADRESVFYLNVLDVPPAPKSRQDNNYVQLAIRTRIKLFYRPATLTSSPDEAADSVTWERMGRKIRLYNPSAYHVSINQLLGPQKNVLSADIGMAAPFSHIDFALKADAAVPDEGNLNLVTVNDFGGNTSHAIGRHR